MTLKITKKLIELREGKCNLYLMKLVGNKASIKNKKGSKRET